MNIPMDEILEGVLYYSTALSFLIVICYLLFSNSHLKNLNGTWRSEKRCENCNGLLWDEHIEDGMCPHCGTLSDRGELKYKRVSKRYSYPLRKWETKQEYEKRLENSSENIN